MSTAQEAPPITALAPWFGSNRTLAENVGRALAGCRWVGVGFAGGMSELLHIGARVVVVNDLHAHVLNLAGVVADDLFRKELIERIERVPYHPDALAAAQARCREREESAGESWFGWSDGTALPDVAWALDYFVCAWMSRNGCAGTKDEFEATYSMRWDAGGGGSATRFRNAAAGLDAWGRVMRRCEFVRSDVLKFLGQVKDRAEHGVYCDPPFPDVGDGYKYAFSTDDQRKLAAKLAAFKRCAVVVRFYDHPLIRELYPEPLWRWQRFEGKKQTNEVATEEVLLTRNEPEGEA